MFSPIYSKCSFKQPWKSYDIPNSRVHFIRAVTLPNHALSACVHTCVFIKTRNARPGKVGCNYRQRASERANGNGHFGHGCCHSHVKHNAPGYHYRCVTPPRKTGDGVRRRGGAKRAGAGRGGDGGSECAARSQEPPGRRCRCHCPRLQRTWFVITLLCASDLERSVILNCE